MYLNLCIFENSSFKSKVIIDCLNVILLNNILIENSSDIFLLYYGDNDMKTSCPAVDTQ